MSESLFQVRAYSRRAALTESILPCNILFCNTTGVGSAFGVRLQLGDLQVRNYVRDLTGTESPYSMGPTWERPGQDQAFMYSYDCSAMHSLTFNSFAFGPVSKQRLTSAADRMKP